MGPSVHVRACAVAVMMAAVLSSSMAQSMLLNTPACNKVRNSSTFRNMTGTGSPIRQTILLWQGIVLIVCFGAFALFISLIHRIIRTYIYYDAHLLDTYFDGGSDVNLGLVACSVVAKWTWAGAIVQSSGAAAKFGIVGHFWFAAAGVVQILLFAIMAAEIRIKAPGAKTYLQVIRARYGAPAHITLIVFSFVANILIMAMVMTEGTLLTSAMVQGLKKEIAVVVLALVIAVFTVVAGVGGSIYLAYFSCAFIMSVLLVFLTDFYYNPLQRPDNTLGSADTMYSLLSCGKGPVDNSQSSFLTFVSRGGLTYGVLMVLSGFSPVFVSQNFWQSAVAAKPGHGVWGFLTGAVAWFAVPFCMAFSLGLGYVVITLKQGGKPILSMAELESGFAPLVAAQYQMGVTGDFLLYVLIIIAVITTASSEVIAASSIIVYDIYKTYISPFRGTPIPDSKTMSIRMQKAIRNEEYLEYDRRCVILKHVVVVSVAVLLIPIGLIFIAIGIDFMWLYWFTGIVVGSCVVPIALAITWHRMTGAGVAAGAIGGFLCSIIAWLILASTYPGGLRNFRANTGRFECMLVGNAVALGAGGLFCIVLSLSCGGCDTDLHEDEEWEKTRYIDNPILPWSVKYAADIGQTPMTRGRPHFYSVRRAFKSAEICAYIFGVLLAVLAVLVWPAVMLTVDKFSLGLFQSWTILVLIWGCVAAIYLILFPLIMEIFQTCWQAYHNRLWVKTEQRDTMSEIGGASTITKNMDDDRGLANSAYAGSDIHEPAPAPIPPPLPDQKDQRWKTYIHLD